MLVYAFLGGLFVAVQFMIMNKLKQAGKAKIWPNGILVLITNAIMMFSFAWVYGSLVEFEVQAAFMGLVTYGAVGVIFAIIAYRVIKNDGEKEVKSQVAK